MKYDLHSHSKYSSDGVLDPKEIVKIAIKKGLDGIAITDHNTIKGGLKAKEYELEDFKIIVGSETKTDRGDVIGLFLEREIVSRNFHEVVEDIREQGGIVVLPHPFDSLRKPAFTPTKDDVKYIDCIEGYNSRCVFQKYNEEAIDFAVEHGLKIVAGSDAHFRNEIANAGIETDGDGIKKAILNGEAKIFYKKSSIMEHSMTKALKLWRKLIDI